MKYLAYNFYFWTKSMKSLTFQRQKKPFRHTLYLSCLMRDFVQNFICHKEITLFMACL